MGEPLRKAWRLSDTALGTLGTAFTLLYAVVGLPFGRLAAQLRARIGSNSLRRTVRPILRSNLHALLRRARLLMYLLCVVDTGAR